MRCFSSLGKPRYLLPVYRYFEVPVEQFREFLATDSKGRYFRQNILGQFAYQRIRKARRATV